MSIIPESNLTGKAGEKKSRVRTWHHGLIARWWREFNRDGKEIDYFRRIIERFGTPALDAGCGGGRLLIPYLKAGLEVEGCDATADIIAACRARAEEEGLSPKLHHQAMCHLDLEQRYRTVFACGAFALGGSRADDQEALRRFYRHLEPGGALALDLHLPNVDSRSWQRWVHGHQPELPGPWSKSDRRTAADGTELEIKTRLLELDPLEQSYVREIRIEHYRDEELLGREQYDLAGSMYLKNELELMLQLAGFEEIEIQGNYEERAPIPYQDAQLVFIARRPA